VCRRNRFFPECARSLMADPTAAAAAAAADSSTG